MVVAAGQGRLPGGRGRRPGGRRSRGRRVGRRSRGDLTQAAAGPTTDQLQTTTSGLIIKRFKR